MNKSFWKDNIPLWINEDSVLWGSGKELKFWPTKACELGRGNRVKAFQDYFIKSIMKIWLMCSL